MYKNLKMQGNFKWSEKSLKSLGIEKVLSQGFCNFSGIFKINLFLVTIEARNYYRF